MTAPKRLIPRRVLPPVTEMPPSFVRLIGRLYEMPLTETRDQEPADPEGIPTLATARAAGTRRRPLTPIVAIKGQEGEE